MFTVTYKNIKNLVSEIFKHNGSGKPYAKETLHIGEYANTNIQDKYNLIPKTSPVDYADMLPPIKNMQGKNELCRFSNMHSWKMISHHLQEQ